MSYRQAYNHSSAMNGYYGDRIYSRDFHIPYVTNGPAVFSANSTRVQRNSYPPPLRTSYRQHPTIPEAPYPPSPPTPPPLPPLRSNFHPANITSQPISIKRPTIQPPPPPPPPRPPQNLNLQNIQAQPLSIQSTIQPQPPPPPESSTSSEDQHRRMENLIDAAGPPDYDSDRASEYDEVDDNNECSTSQEIDEEDNSSDHSEREAQTQTQDLDDDENKDDSSENDGEDVVDGNQDCDIDVGNKDAQTITTHDAGVGTDETDRPSSRHVTINEHHDSGWQRRSHRSQMKWDEVEAPWARLPPRQLSGRRFQEPKRMKDRARPKQPRQNHYHEQQRDLNSNFVDHRLPIMNPVRTKLHHNDIDHNRHTPSTNQHLNPVYRDKYIHYDPRKTYFPPRQLDDRLYKQKYVVDTRNVTHPVTRSDPRPKREKPSMLLCTGCCVIVLLVFALLVLVALSAVLAYYFVVYDDNTTNHPCSSLPEFDNGFYSENTAPSNTVGDIIRFGCDSGYIADPETRFITCENDLTWDHKPLCLVPSTDLTGEQIGLLAGAVGAGALALGFLVIVCCLACTNVFRRHNYAI